MERPGTGADRLGERGRAAHHEVVSAQVEAAEPDGIEREEAAIAARRAQEPLEGPGMHTRRAQASPVLRLDEARVDVGGAQQSGQLDGALLTASGREEPVVGEGSAGAR